MRRPDRNGPAFLPDKAPGGGEGVPLRRRGAPGWASARWRQGRPNRGCGHRRTPVLGHRTIRGRAGSTGGTDVRFHPHRPEDPGHPPARRRTRRHRAGPRFRCRPGRQPDHGDKGPDRAGSSHGSGLHRSRLAFRNRARLPRTTTTAGPVIPRPRPPRPPRPLPPLRSTTTTASTRGSSAVPRAPTGAAPAFARSDPRVGRSPRSAHHPPATLAVPLPSFSGRGTHVEQTRHLGRP